MNAHFIDFDLILESESKPWIIDKRNPNIPIIKIDKHDFNLFKSGIYKSQGNKISFNGTIFWLSNDFMNRLKVKSKQYKVDISNLAISMQEFLNKDLVENIPFELKLDLFSNIINTNDDIFIICSKNTKENFEKQIQKFESNLKEMGLMVKKYYFISETFYNRDLDDISYVKSKIIIQHLLGLKTEVDKLTSDKIDEYNSITLYDDDLKSITMSKNINSILEKMLIKTDNNVKLSVKETLKNNEKILIIKEYTHNRSNRFNEYQIGLEFSNVIKSYENFKF
jgi:flavodoxin